MSTKIIKCEAVYKIFGAGAKKMLQDASGNVDAKTFQEAGCIVGVNNASFEVSKGELLVVMGLSGSGKSTLLRCISRLTDATAGKIFIEGQDLLSLKNKELIELRRNKMGMV
ncbi:MAG: ATP-binding cassette domain-containing protein, partial [Gammaproteobacteria bacterium]|nr:ATP-binding cassette domain-containing protein [Gammaproteobacteria bacterium]